jgi:exopolysaccharide biosynthesis polyprenyl glycosylphosphotransferase
LPCYDSPSIFDFPETTSIAVWLATKGWTRRVQKTQTMAPANQTYAARTIASALPWLTIATRALQMFADACLAWVAFWVAWQVRYEFELGGTVPFYSYRPFSEFQERALIFAGLTLAILAIRGVYWLPRSTGLLDESVMIIGGLTTAMAGVILTAFLTRFVPSRLVFIYAWILAIVLFVLRRALSRSIRTSLWKRGLYVDRVLVVGSADSGRRIMEAMLNNPSLGYNLVGFADDLPETSDLSLATEHRVVRAPRLGSLDDIERLVTQFKVDEVIVALPAHQIPRITGIIEQCHQRSVEFKVVPDLLQLSLDRVDLGEVAGLPLIGVKPASIQGGQLLAKRGIDILAGAFVLLVASIPMAIIALLVRFSSKGPILYRQTRVGKDGQEFTLVKFRCMVNDADEMRAQLMEQHSIQDPRLFKLRDDPRLTRVGRILRRWSLDELPQFWHVFWGQMSLVGPRPQMPSEVEAYEEWHQQRLAVTPGLTGLWQVNGRSNLSFDEMVRLDLYYAEHWSPWLDMKIVLRTVPAVILGRGAY